MPREAFCVGPSFDRSGRAGVTDHRETFRRAIALKKRPNCSVPAIDITDNMDRKKAVIIVIKP